MAPGDRVSGLATRGPSVRFCGTSTAVPFVTGALALLWSEFPSWNAADLLAALTISDRSAHASSPPLLNAWRSYLTLCRSEKSKAA